MDSDEDFVVDAPSTKKTKKGGGEEKKKGRKKSVTKDDKPSVSPKRKTTKSRKSDDKDAKKKEKEKEKEKEKPKAKAKAKPKKKAEDDEDAEEENLAFKEFGDNDDGDDDKENFNPNEEEDEADADDDDDDENSKSKKKTPKAKKATGDEPKDADQRKIYEYMKKQNRPYSQQNVFDNLHGEIKKAACQRALDALADDGYLQAKDFGKSRVYLYNQQNIPDVDKNDMDKLKKELNQVKEQSEEAEKDVKEMNAKLKSLTASLTNQQLIEEVEKYKKLVEASKNKLEVFTNGNYKQISDEDMKKAEDKKKKFETEYKKRKRMCMDMVNMISESMEQKPAQLAETIGIDMD